jgi:glutathione S-transferase
MTTPLTWPELQTHTTWQIDPANGPTNAQSRLRLFGQPESAIRVTLFRDHHAWCPYCQKIWLWLEEQRIPYRIEKVTMFCYGEKEAWYKRKVPSGMLPAVELDGKIITESDDILIALERVFGPLKFAMDDPRVIPMRRLERLLFRAWCNWLCYPARSPRDDQAAREKFQEIMGYVEEALGSTPGPYFLEEFSTADTIFMLSG